MNGELQDRYRGKVNVFSSRYVLHLSIAWRFSEDKSGAIGSNEGNDLEAGSRQVLGDDPPEPLFGISHKPVSGQLPGCRPLSNNPIVRDDY